MTKTADELIEILKQFKGTQKVKFICPETGGRCDITGIAEFHGEILLYDAEEDEK